MVNKDRLAKTFVQFVEIDSVSKEEGKVAHAGAAPEKGINRQVV